MVECVNNNQSLGAYMQEHIWKPLGITSTTFRLQQRPDIKCRRADMSMRAEDGSIQPSPTRHFPEDCADDYGGAGAYSCAADYIRLLTALLKNDSTLLQPASIDILFSPGLAPAAAQNLQDYWETMKEESQKDDIKIRLPDEVDYALGGMVSNVDVSGGRRAGSMSWGGLPNLSWLVDREACLALFYASQLLPPDDRISMQIFRMFEGAVYGGELVRHHSGR
jgi:CubicO group peptidase (beta-lactamase class C family)